MCLSCRRRCIMIRAWPAVRNQVPFDCPPPSTLHRYSVLPQRLALYLVQHASAISLCLKVVDILTITAVPIKVNNYNFEPRFYTGLLFVTVLELGVDSVFSQLERGHSVSRWLLCSSLPSQGLLAPIILLTSQSQVLGFVQGPFPLPLSRRYGRVRCVGVYGPSSLFFSDRDLPRPSRCRWWG